MMPGTQAKMARLIQARALLGSLATTRSPARDRVMLLWSMKAGRRGPGQAFPSKKHHVASGFACPGLCPHKLAAQMLS